MATVLLIEDNYELLRLYIRYLRNEQHTIQPSMTAEAALDVFGQVKFDLIISDLRLGSFSIERLIKRLKHINDNGTPVLVISAHLDVYDQMCDKHGLHHMLAKPIEKQTMIDKVRLILESADAVNTSIFIPTNIFNTTEEMQAVSEIAALPAVSEPSMPAETSAMPTVPETVITTETSIISTISETNEMTALDATGTPPVIAHTNETSTMATKPLVETETPTQPTKPSPETEPTDKSNK